MLFSIDHIARKCLIIGVAAELTIGRITHHGDPT